MVYEQIFQDLSYQNLHLGTLSYVLVIGYSVGGSLLNSMPGSCCHCKEARGWNVLQLLSPTEQLVHCAAALSRDVSWSTDFSEVCKLLCIVRNTQTMPYHLAHRVTE